MGQVDSAIVSISLRHAALTESSFWDKSMVSHCECLAPSTAPTCVFPHISHQLQHILVTHFRYDSLLSLNITFPTCTFYIDKEKSCENGLHCISSPRYQLLVNSRPLLHSRLSSERSGQGTVNCRARQCLCWGTRQAARQGSPPPR